MNQTITVTGLVLSATPVLEYDKRVVLLTKERGKISAFAKGARRPNSLLIGVVNPFTFGKFQLYEGRNSYTIHSASIDNYFMELREDMEAAYYGFYFMDIANYYAREANDETMMLKLIYQTLRALSKKSIPFPLVRRIYELKAVTINGEGPQVFQCIKCGEKDVYAFSVMQGGGLCKSCCGDIIDCVPITNSALYTMQYIVSTNVEKLYMFRVTQEVQNQLNQMMNRYYDVYIEKNFKSLDILNTIISV